MGKRLTEAEKEEREIKRILQKIKKFEKIHPQNLVERACYKYKQAHLKKRSAEKEIEGLQEKLQDAKKRLD